MENENHPTAQPSEARYRQGMTPAGILCTLRGLHWFLLYMMLYFALGILNILIINGITPAISAPATYIHTSPQAVFRWLYFGSLGFGYCGSLLWLWLSHQRSAASWGWLIFAFLDMITTPFLCYYSLAQKYVDIIQTASGTSVPVSGELVLYGFLFALVPLAYLIWAAVRAPGSKQMVDDEDAVPEQMTDILTVSPGGIHWFVALLLTFAAAFVMYPMIELGYALLSIKVIPLPVLENVIVSIFYTSIAVMILGFLLWVRITYKRYTGSANWRVGAPVLLIELIVIVFLVAEGSATRRMDERYLEYYNYFSSESFSFSVVHLIIALALACLPLLYMRRIVQKAQANDDRS